MTYQEYFDKSLSVYYEHIADGPNAWRLGQSFFNVLRDDLPELAEEIWGGDLDPFYVDGKLDKFLPWIEDRLDKRAES